MILSGLRRRRQLGEGVLLDDVYVSRGDSAAGIDIIAEVGGRDWLKGLRFAQVSVTTGNNSAGVDVAKKHTHGDGNVADVGAIVYSRQIYRHGLRIGHAGAVHRHLIAGDAGGGGISGTGGGTKVAEARFAPAGPIQFWDLRNSPGVWFCPRTPAISLE